MSVSFSLVPGNDYMDGFRRFSIGICLLALLNGCQDNTTQEVSEKRQARPIKLHTVEVDEAEWRHSFPAIVKAAESRQLFFQTAGVVKAVLVKEAERVAKGDLLIQLDARTTRADLESAQAQYEKTRQDYESAKRLFKQNAIARTVYKEREATFKKAEAALSIARKTQEDTEILAPFNGLVASVPTDTSQNVTAGPPAITIFTTEEFEAIINMPASLLGRYSNTPATRATVYLAMNPDQPIVAKFKEASLEADEIAQTYPVSFSFQPPDEGILLPGMNATLELSTQAKAQGNNEKSITVPLSAIASDGEQSYVWVVDPNTSAVSKRVITLKKSIGPELIVASGLSAGETIAAAGVHYLEENMPVKAWPERPQ